MKKKALIALIALLTPALLYSAFWYILKTRIDAAIPGLIQQATAEGLVIEGNIPPVTGFPGPPAISTKDIRITSGGTLLDIPALEFKGFPIPGLKLSLLLERGAAITGVFPDGTPVDTEIWSVNKLGYTGKVPRALPAVINPQSLKKWRQSGGHLQITDFDLVKQPLEVKGTGDLRLDENLQPEGQVSADVYGYMAFLGFLEKKKLTKTKQALIAGALMEGLSKEDEKSGNRYIKADITIQNRRLLWGSFSLAELPLIPWDSDSPPAPLQ